MIEPRLTVPERIARFVLSGTLGESAVGDLREERFSRRISGRRLELWTWGQVAAILWHCTSASLGELFPSAGEIRQAFRSVHLNAGLSLSIIGIIALAVGVNSAVFSVANAVLFKPLPFREPARVIQLFESAEPKAEFGRILMTRPENYYQWKEQNKVFQQMSAYQQRKVALNGAWGADLVIAHRVLEDYFETLGTQPFLGRTFDAGDYANGRVALLSFDLWQTRFGADVSIVGKSVLIDGVEHSVTGVMPKGFYPAQSGKPALWIPLVLTPALKASKVDWILWPVARLKDGITVSQAQTAMATLAERLRRERGNGSSIAIMPIATYILGYQANVFFLLLAASALVVLVACVNVANLLLARGLDRQKEFSVRLALGASRIRLIRTALLEGLIPALFGGLVGLALAWWLVGPISNLLPANRVARIDEVSIDWETALFACGCAALSGLLFSLVPALRSTGTDPQESLRESGRIGSPGMRASRLSGGLVVTEVALAVLLLSGAGLLARSFFALQRADTGVSVENLLTMQILLPGEQYSGTEKIAAGLRRIQERVSSVPGVLIAGAGVRLPFEQAPNPWGFVKEGEALGKTNRTTNIQQVSPQFFSAMGMRTLTGRPLRPDDLPGREKVVVINKALADRYWPGDNPVGRQITIDLGDTKPQVTIVGVVSDARFKGVRSGFLGEVFLPLTQWPYPRVYLTIRTQRDPLSLASAIRAELAGVDRDIPVLDIRTMKDVFDQSLWQPRLAAAVIGAFSLLALALSAAGVFALVSYSVARRSRELGIRAMIGASRGDILGLVLRQGLRLAGAGLAAGIAASLVLTRFLSSQLYGVKPQDLPTLAGVSSLMLAVSIFASFLPARRKSRGDPMTACRME